MQGDISVQMLAGTQSTTSFQILTHSWLTLQAVCLFKLSGGLDWYVTTYGISDTAAVLGTFGFTELDDIIDNFIANKAPTDQMVFMGSRAYGLISKSLKT
jgi:hypothetical protein